MKYSAIARAFLLVFLVMLAFAQPQASTPLSRLQASIERITKSINADWGIYIKCLETGEEMRLHTEVHPSIRKCEI